MKNILKHLTAVVLVTTVLIGCKKDTFVEDIGLCPLVVSTDPANGATNVPLNQIITITFNEAMDPATITLQAIIISGATVVPGTLTYSGLDATFVPSAPLLANTTYTGRVKTSVKDPKGNFLQEDYVWTFSTGVVISPMVISTDPANLENGVALNKVITATFSMSMDPLTIDGASFTVFQGTNQIAGIVAYSGVTASFMPTSNLSPNTIYTATITTAAENTFGVPLAANYVWNFRTDTIAAPLVISTDPSNGETNVALNKTVTATFSELMNPLTISGTTFTLKQGVNAIAGVVTYSGSVASFNPTTDLAPNTTYTGTITTGAQNIFGIPLVNNYVWTFQTGAIVGPMVVSTIPVNNAMNVPLAQTLSATFSQIMDPLTINSSTFTLFDGLTPIAGVVSYTGSTASFNPTVNLNPNTTYTATITTGARNSFGVAMAASYSWVFETITGNSPIVTITDPLDNATGVLLNQTLTAIFSQVMDPLSINGASFTLFNGITPVPGVVSYAGSTASFNPSGNLLPNTTYTATISNSVQNTFGVNMVSNYVWTFQTISVLAPTVIVTNPLNNATNVPLNQSPTATFSQNMDPLTITGTSFTLFQGLTQISGVVSYVGTTATFNPNIDLLPNTTYTATIYNTVENTFGMNMVTNHVWTFQTQTVLPPTVVVTVPLNNASNVPVNQTLSANFSQNMNPLTITGTSFTLFQGLTQISGVVSYAGTTATLNPNIDLLPNTTYTATIYNTVENTFGMNMVNNYVWTFQTASGIAPTVIITDPLANATNVLLNKTVTATFSQAMDPLTINGTSFTLFDGLTQINGVVSYAGTTASLNPNVDLMPNTTYTATIVNTVENTFGTPMVNNYVWTFQTTAGLAPTVVLTVPLDNATNVLLNQTLSATFNMAMDPLTVNGTSFVLFDGANQVNGVVNMVGTTAYLNPNADLLPNTTYTATIINTVENTFGVPMANNHVWTFQTAGGLVPLVVSTDPFDNENNVIVSKTATATFNMAMSAFTINTNTFTLYQGSNQITGVAIYNSLTFTASFNPDADLDPNTTYTATITTGAENVFGTGLASDYVWSFTTAAPVVVPPAINLGSVANFGIISGVGVSNNAGPSEIHDMDVGIYPGARSSITGFMAVDGGPGLIFNGAFYAADDAAPIPAMLLQAKNDLTAAYLAAEGATAPAPTTVSGDLGGQTLAPGIYKSTSTLMIQNGNLTLDAQGDPNAFWIFQIAAGFTTVGGAPYPSPAGGNVILSGGAQAKNVFWQVGTSAVIGDYTSFNGNILALTSITMNAYSRATGRMLCSNGAVVLTSTNIINKP